MRWRATAARMFAMLVIATSAVAAEPCRERADLVGPCFHVHGRAALYNGNPSVRIWKVGTRRLLGVSESRMAPGVDPLPVEVRRALDWEHPVFADFVLCPFTRERPGVMQLVCVEAATRLRRAGAAD
jgi:hypothetical protein